MNENKQFVILHIGFKHGSDDNRIYRKECVSLAKNPQYDVTYVTSDCNKTSDTDEHGNAHKYVIKAYPKRVIRQFIYLKEIKKYISVKKNVDIIHLHETTLLLIALWAKKRGIKVIYDSHENYYEQLKASRGSAIAYAYKIYEKHVCKRIDACIFPCKMLEKEVFDYDVKRMVYIDNYPILRHFAITEERNPEFTACYTGGIAYTRGTYHAAEAWGKAGIKGILAGRYQNDDIRQKIEALPNFKDIDYKGWVNPEDLEDIYKASSVGMANLLNVGQYHKTRNFPTKVLEYCMYGLPVIIYRSKFVEEVFSKYRFGIMVDPENVDEMAEALKKLKDDPDTAMEMGRQGRKAVEEYFNWESQERKLHNLYREITEEIKTAASS